MLKKDSDSWWEKNFYFIGIGIFVAMMITVGSCVHHDSKYMNMRVNPDLKLATHVVRADDMDLLQYHIYLCNPNLTSRELRTQFSYGTIKIADMTIMKEKDGVLSKYAREDLNSNNWDGVIISNPAHIDSWKNHGLIVLISVSSDSEATYPEANGLYISKDMGLEKTLSLSQAQKEVSSTPYLTIIQDGPKSRVISLGQRWVYVEER